MSKTNGIIDKSLWFSGGRLLISNIVKDASPIQPSLKGSYDEVSLYKRGNIVLRRRAMKELRSNVSFTQLRFYCSKQQGRTFHVTTAANSTGEAVVQYFSGQTDARLDACGSFVRMEDDNSAMAKVCKKWEGTKSLDQFTNKWSLDDQNYEKWLYDHVVLVWYNNIGCFHQKVRDSNAMILRAVFRQVIFGRYMCVEDSIDKIIIFAAYTKITIYIKYFLR